MKIIEIKGIGIPNKGAELMLHSILQHFEEGNEEAIYAVEPNADYASRARYGLHQMARFVLKGRSLNLAPALGILPLKLRRQYGVILDSEVNVILDASGFAYGDQWGAEKAQLRLGRKIAKWKALGKKVILLPQAFGPFDGPGMATVMKDIVTKADLVFARDDQSFAYLDALVPNKVLKCPDFTNLVKVPSFDGLSAYYGRACIIPNSKMITMKKTTMDAYSMSLAKAITRLSSAGERPFILIHEGKGDLEVAKRVQAILNGDVEILQIEDALKIKFLIGKCSIVVSARFHGLVSALSQGIPVVAMGWSHKYEELLANYGISDLLADPNSSVDVIEKIERILDPQYLSKTLASIKANVEPQKQKVREMWTKVDEVILAP